jgi:tetratricopeptide (TPR) repeat protein
MVDDVHWADVPSRRFLAYLLRRLDGIAVLVALATRPPEPAWDDELLHQIIRSPSAHLVRPGPLSDAGVATLIIEQLSDRPTERFVRACREVTLGNPLLLRELLLELAIRRVAVDDTGAAAVRGVGPANVSRIVLRRLAQVSTAAQGLARAAAVLDETELRYAAALCRLDLAEAADAAGELVRLQVLHSEPHVRFVHPIVRTAIYAETPAAERAAYHAHAARLLEADQAPPDQVAAHLVATLPSGDPWVVEALRSAAARALSQGTPAAAISYLRRALDEPPVAGALPDIAAQLGVAESRARDPAAIEHLERALALTRAHGSALGSCFRSNVQYRCGMLVDAEADARAALDVAALEGFGPRVPFATAFLIDALVDRGKLDEASQALARFDTAAADPDVIAANPLLVSRGRLRVLRGDVERGLGDLLEAGRRGAAWGARTPAFLPWRSTAALALAPLGRHEQAASLAGEELELARAFGAPRPLASRCAPPACSPQESKRSTALPRRPPR